MTRKAAAGTPRNRPATGLSIEVSAARPATAAQLSRPRGQLPSARTTQPSAAVSPMTNVARPAVSSVSMATAAHSAAARGLGTRCRTSSNDSKPAESTAAAAAAWRVPVTPSRYGASSE